MTLRSARRAAREAYHRAAHLDTDAELPDHAPEDCDAWRTLAGGQVLAESRDIPAYRLDAIMGAVWPIVRRFAIQEFARRHGRRVVQFTPAEVVALRRGVQLVMESATGQQNRGQLSHFAALRRALAKLDDLDA